MKKQHLHKEVPVLKMGVRCFCLMFVGRTACTPVHCCTCFVSLKFTPLARGPCYLLERVKLKRTLAVHIVVHALFSFYQPSARMDESSTAPCVNRAVYSSILGSTLELLGNFIALIICKFLEDCLINTVQPL